MKKVSSKKSTDAKPPRKHKGSMVSILLKPELHSVVKEHSKRQGMSISTYIRCLVIKHTPETP